MQGVTLKVEGLIQSAKFCAEDGQSFDEFCDMISRVIISGQTVDEIRTYMTSLGIDKIFEDVDNT